MKSQCRECQRLNPPEAAFCYYDGTPIDRGTGAGGANTIDFATWSFPMPFVFPSGATCQNFLQLALACRNNLPETIEVLQQGFLEGFFGAMGRADLAWAAKAAAKAPDPDRAVDELLGKMPGSPLKPGKLEVEPLKVNLGTMAVGEDRQLELKLTNQGDRLLHGKVSVEACPWLVVGESGTAEKRFQFFESAAIPVHVRGKLLRAYYQPQKVEIEVESNGGNFTVELVVAVPIKPFAQGAMAGATSPRQLALKAKAHTKEAAALLEDGTVARWYEENGWEYPVQGQTATGIAAVQQFFEVLGLVKPPKMELKESSVALRGRPGERVEHVLAVVTHEKRAAVAHGVSDQPWLTVGKTTFLGQVATIPLIVEAIPNHPNRRLTTQVKVTANGNQRFDVPVTLQVGDGPWVDWQPEPSAPVAAPTQASTDTISVLPLAPEELVIQQWALPEPSPLPATSGSHAVVSHGPPPLPASSPSIAVPPPLLSSTAPAAPSARVASRKQLLLRLLPVGIVAIGLLTAVGRDLLYRDRGAEALPEVDHANPALKVQFHEAVLPLKEFIKDPSMRFGLGTPDPKDPKSFKSRLIYDEYGRTCNVCVRVDDAAAEYLWGVEQGSWKNPIKEALGQGGARATWVRAGPPISIVQHVELVPGGLSEDGKKRRLDTCLIRYEITNDDGIPHKVGLRFLLDTYIGGKDGVPFVVAGETVMQDALKTFGKPSEVPDYLAAMERQDLKIPGTLAHLTLKYGSGLEPPARVVLGAWPAASLKRLPGGEKAEAHSTRWEVPTLAIDKAKSQDNPNGDSAVVLYWDEKEIAPKQTRVVGFAYGLGSVSVDDGNGQLGMTAGGELAAGKEFTLTAFVKNPSAGMTVTLALPRGVDLVSGSVKELVPAIPAGSSSPFSPVTWRVKAARAGVHRVKATLSSGAKLEHRLVVRPDG